MVHFLIYIYWYLWGFLLQAAVTAQSTIVQELKENPAPPAVKVSFLLSLFIFLYLEKIHVCPVSRPCDLR